jgi:hypothetical protein
VTAPSGQAAIDNARQVDGYPVGYCLKYVRAEAWRVGSLYASAIDAWHGAVRRHPGDRRPPAGAPMFYAGGQYGHIVICTRADTEDIRSTDMPYAGHVDEGDLDWPVTHWGQEYLGWAEDLNAVDLPLGEEDEMTSEDWDKLRDIVREEVHDAVPHYVTSILAGEVDDRAPDPTTVKKALRLSADHARE